MARNNPIASWLYLNRQVYDVQFTKMKWTANFDIALSDFEVCCSFKGKKLTGRGVDLDKDIALEKASSELLERMICADLGIDTVGVAASVVIDAKEHAKFEALERYFLKQHIGSQVSLKECFVELPLNHALTKKLDCSIRFFEIQTLPGDKGIVAQITSDDFFSYGFSYGNNWSRVAEKALIEALPNYAWKLLKTDTKESPWQVSDSFHKEFAPLIMQSSSNNEIPKPKLQEATIDSKNLFCSDLAGLKIYRFTT